MPQASVTVTLTGVVPIGKLLPLGGVAVMFTGAQPPVDEAEKNTTALLELVATVVMFDGQVSVNIGLTVTLKLQCCVLPQLSLAVACTGVVPIGNVLPLGGLAIRNGGGLQPPEALTLKKTVAPLGPVAVVVILDEQDIVRG